MTQRGAKSRPSATQIRVKNEIHEMVKEYSDATGVSITRVFEDAMTDWLKTVGAARLEVLRSQQHRLAALIPFPKDGVAVVGTVS